MKADENQLSPTPGIPPWMWFFMVSFTLHLPELIRSWHDSYENLLANIESMERLRAVDPNAERFSVLSYPGYFTESLPDIALFLGISTILFPHLRAFAVERKNKLGAPPATIKSLAEILEWIKIHAPGLKMKVNLKRPGLAFVYPDGFRRTTLAIFSGFILLWKIDREAAEAVLLHETTHSRRGDALFLGPGSFLETALRLTLLFYMLFVVLPYVATAVDQKIQLFESIQKMNAMQRELNEISRNAGLPANPEQAYLLPLLKSVFLSIFGLLAMTTSFLVRTVVSFILPVGAIWAAEFNADMLVAENARYQNALVRELTKPQARISWWRRTLFRLSHPPDKLRRFVLGRRESIAFLLLLLIYPLAKLLRIGVLHVWAFTYEMGNTTTAAIAGQQHDFNWQKFLEASVHRTQIALHSQSAEWLMMTGLLLIWIVAVRPWEHFFMGKRMHLPVSAGDNKTGVPPKSHFKYYFLAAACTGAIFLLTAFWKK